MSELNILFAQRGGGATQARDPDLEGDPGAMRRPVKKHRDMLSSKGPFRPAASLDRVRKVEQASELTALKIGDVQEVPARKTRHKERS